MHLVVLKNIEQHPHRIIRKWLPVKRNRTTLLVLADHQRLSDNRDRSVRDDPLGDQVSYSDQDMARYGVFLSVDLLLDDVPSHLRSSGPFDNLLGQVVC